MMIRIAPLVRKLIVVVLCAAVTVFALAGGGGQAVTHGFPAAMSDVGHDHDRSHVGDRSHDTPTAAVLIGFRFVSPKDSQDQRSLFRH